MEKRDSWPPLILRSLRRIRREEKESDLLERVSYVNTDLAGLAASHETNEVNSCSESWEIK